MVDQLRAYVNSRSRGAPSPCSGRREKEKGKKGTVWGRNRKVMEKTEEDKDER